MQELYKSGRYFFAMAVMAFGLIQFITGHFMSGFLPLKASLPGQEFMLYFFSTLFFLSGLALLIDKTALGAARIIFLLFFVFFFYPHLFTLISDLHNGGEWTVLGETMGLAGGALIFIGIFTKYPYQKDRLLSFLKNKISAGRFVFALCLIIFAVLHFVYADYIATLIPSWIPFPLFWAYLVGVAFLAASVSILTNIKTRLACTLLGFMFLFWVIFLHAPRVFASPLKEPEWTSLFIALGFAGVFFTIGGLESGKTEE